MVVGPISDMFPVTVLTEFELYNEPAPGILFMPFFIPAFLSIFLKYHQILPFIFDTVWFRVSSFILFNWGLYGIIAYFVLGRFKRFKKQEKVVSDEPPPPSLYQ